MINRKKQLLFHGMALIGLLTLPLLARQAPIEKTPRAKAVATYAYADPTHPIDLPTALAIGSDATVYLLDGVHNRVLVFGPDGGFRTALSRFGQETLNQPVGLRVARSGNLWIADSGNGRVLIVTPEGELVRSLQPPATEGATRADPTDIAIAGDEQSAWIVDNDGHRLLRYGLAENTWQVVGAFGESLGQFEFPCQIAANSAGDVFVSDVVNARVQMFSPAGAPLRNFGAFGVEPGQLYRPSGVAVDAEGRVWIADSVLGVVQIFHPQGEFLDVLRDEGGEVLRLEGPMGIAFDSDSALYVVEQTAHRARKFTLSNGDPKMLPAATPRSSGTINETQSKTCAICHLDWTPPFSEGRDSALLKRPVTTPADPVVSRIEMCLSCHNGLVGDSRRRVWDEHGHRTGVAPPAGMTIPPNLPLIDGKLGCRTCHSAHGPGVPQGDIRKAVMLRAPNVAGEMCISCHADKARGPRFGTHPTGGMPWAVPPALIDAGAKVGPNPRELTCQVCHTPHGAAYDHLLVQGTTSNQLCMNCHDAMRPGMFRDGSHAEHPLRPLLRPEQLDAIDKMGTRVGEEGRLVCLSCHKLHHGKGDRFLLAAELHDGELCLNCHAERREMLGTPHDLRAKFANERNRLGMTVEQGGPCSSCHLFHRFARQPVPSAGDARGLCITCHREGACAENKRLSDLNHPSMGCSECHNPHNTAAGHFLAEKPEILCARCHADKAKLTGGPHDAAFGAAGSCLAGGGGDRCLACHRPHAEETGTLWRVPPSYEDGSDGLCLNCHADADRHAGVVAALHPTAWPANLASGTLRPGTSGDGTPRIGCRTCHNPHGSSDSGALLNVKPGASGESLCLTCHTSMQAVQHTAHASSNLASRGLDAQACAPCHTMHAEPGAVARDRLWPLPLRAEPAADETQVGDAYCTACHRAGGPASVPAAVVHPHAPMFAVSTGEANRGLPLYDELGVESANGRIACRTCHLPHGREDVVSAAPKESVRASRPQLRPFVAPNVCTTCHGADGLRRFLYFHDPQRRGPTSK